MKKIVRFLVSVKKEMKKVRWPEKKEMIENTIATLACILIFGLFFTSLDLIFSVVKTVIR